MIGLLRNSFYGAIRSAVILLFVILAVGLALVITGRPTLLTLFVIISAVAASFVAISSFRRESSTKWSKYELTTPVRRKDIVKAQYISHAIWIVCGIILSAIFVALSVIRHGNGYFFYELRDPLALFCFSAGTALFMGDLFYPITYFMDTDKNEVMMIISLLGAVGLTFGIVWILNAAYGFKPLSDPEFYFSISIYIAVSIVFFLLSYFISKLIYSRKDY